MKALLLKKVILVLSILTALMLFYESFYESDVISSYADAIRHRQERFKFVELNRKILEQNQERPQCSLRWNLDVNETFRNSFNFSVPVLMWAADVRPSMWRRLTDRRVPYGWKNLSSDVVNRSLTLLNKSSEQLFDRGSLPCVRCAVVGNGGILNGSRQGKAIDSHDFVFRVNGAVIEGFEEDVGTKTTFYCFTTNTMKNSLRLYHTDGFIQVPKGQDVQYMFIPTSIRDYLMLTAVIKRIPVVSGEDKGDQPSTYFGPTPSIQNFKMLHPDFINYVKEKFLKSPLLQSIHSKVYRPTTGALMLFAALHTCDQVTAYGFITENHQNFSDHYFDKNNKPLIFYGNHDMKMEKKLWSELHASKIMTLYQRP